MERRQFPRVPVCYLGHISTGDKAALDAVVLDLSLGGCRMHSTTPVVPGARLDLQIALPNQIAPFVVKGATVRWSRQPEFGVSFTGLRPEDQARLCRLM